MAKDPATKKVNFTVDSAFYQGLAAEAARQRISVAELIRRALEAKYTKPKHGH